MYELFELVRLLSVRRQSTRHGPVEVTRFAWRENGECSLLALLCSNDQLLVRWSVSGRAPVLKQLPWPPEKRVSAMCFDPTVSWLLVATEAPGVYILPALALTNPSARVNQLWSLTDCTVIPLSLPGTLCAACWWHTLDDRQVAIVATKVGELFFVDLLLHKVVSKVTTDIQVSDLSLIMDDDQMSTSLLLTGVTSGQWKMVLEARTTISHFSPDSELSDMGYIDIDQRNIPPQSVLDCTDESSAVFSAERIAQSQPWVMLTPQYARGRHFITAHDQKSATLQVYDSEIQFSPLFVYKLPPGAESVILTDRLTFTLSRRNGSQLLILSNQRAETSMETMQEFNDDAVIQKLELPAGERMLGARLRTFPFYWHDKQEETQRQRLRQGTLLEQPAMELVAMEPRAFDIPVTTHTVLDGCIVVTDSAVYECRPRASPERLFLQNTVVLAEMKSAEHLAISVGLDITLLAELAALYLLKAGHVARAIRLFALSKTKPGHKCSHSKRCASLARYGRVAEVVVVVRQALHNAALDLSGGERKVLADTLLHCYVHTLAHAPRCDPQALTAFRDFLAGSFAFDESVALDLLAEYGLTTLLLDFAMGRGLVADALGRLVAKGCLPVALTLLTQLVTRGFSAHVLQAAHGGVLCSLMGEAVMEVLVSKPELVTRHVSLIKSHLPSLPLPLLAALAAILDPSQGAVRNMVRRQASSLHRTASLSSIASYVSTVSDFNDGSQDGMGALSQALEVFLLTVLHINRRRGDHEALTPELVLSDPTLRPDVEGEEERREDKSRSLALQFALASCGSHHTAVVRDGDLYTWGRTAHGRLGHGELVREGAVSVPACVQAFHMLQIRVEAVACGGEHTLALTQQGVYGWGNSGYGQVGVGTRHVYHRPMLLEALLSHTCVSLHCGQYHSLALTADCRVWSWGWGVHGQLGHGDPEDQLFPRTIQRLSGSNVVRAAAGYCHSLVLTEGGEVWSFGCGYFGQLGIGSTMKRTVPVRIKSLTEPVTVIGTKFFHSVAVTASKRVYTWGCHPHNMRYMANAMRRSRQMGQSPAPQGDGMDLFHLPLPVDTTFVHSKEIVQVSCGSLHTLLLTQEGEVYMWGRNLEGQLGTGSRQDERVPKMLTRINDQHVIHVCSGGEFNVALDADFSIWVWGKNDSGQLGLVKTSSSGWSQRREGREGREGAQQHWRQSQLVTSDVVVPTPQRGLPPVNLACQPRWAPTPVMGPTAAVQLTQWVEEGGGEDSMLPSLQALSDLLYHAKVIPIVVKHLGDYLDRTAILQHCVDTQHWLTAGHLCSLEDRHTQALCYRLLGLSKAASDLDIDSFTDLSSKVIAHHLSLALDEGGAAVHGQQQTSSLCVQVIGHWLDHQLPVSRLQHLLEPHLPQLAPHLAKILFRREDSSQPYCRQFSPSFCLRVLTEVITDHSPASEQFLSSCLPPDVPPGTGSPGEAERGGDPHPPQPSPVSLQLERQLIPYQRLWQDIVSNVAKPSHAAACIALSRSQLDHLTVNSADEDAPDGGNGGDGPAAGAVVLFSCGHHFAQTTFSRTVLAASLAELDGGSNPLAAAHRLPATATLLQQYYSRGALLPLACPKCVLNVLRA